VRRGHERWAVLVAVLWAASPGSACAAEAPTVTEAEVKSLIGEAADAPKVLPDAAKPLAGKLDAHVRQLLERAPVAPLFFTTGTHRHYYFNEPRQTIYALSIVLPYLPEETHGKVKAFLSQELKAAPPLTTDYYPAAGKRRYPLEGMPDQKNAGKAAHYGGQTPPKPFHAVWALWNYAYWGGDLDAVRGQWPAVQAAFNQYFQKPPEFKPAHTDDTEWELNRALNSTLGYARLAARMGDAAARERAEKTLLALLQKRLELESDPLLVHNVDKDAHGVPALVRYLEVSWEAGRFLRGKLPGDRLADWINLNAELCPDWWLAWHERPTGLGNVLEFGQWGGYVKSVEYIGGEYFLGAPLLSSSLFLAKARVIEEKPEALEGLLDMPWCVGDLYYVEKVVDTLLAYGQRPWRKLEP
jgi:hypothetical protein